MSAAPQSPQPVVEFRLTASQMYVFKQWRASHGLSKGSGPVGGDFTYSFTPTSIGTIVKVTHDATGKTLNLTEDM